MKYKSVFDIIGPIMVGPSSSHTAGAVRIGLVARNIFGMDFDSAKIHLFGSFAQTYKGHATDVAIVGGLLNFQTDDERIPKSLEIAKEQNKNIEFIIENALTSHPNTVKIIIENKQEKFSLVGVSVGGGSIEIIEINGFSLKLDGENPALLIFHHDAFGTIASVTEKLARERVNISHMEVSRTEKGKTALMIIETDEIVGPEVIEELGKQAHILKIITLEV